MNQADNTLTQGVNQDPEVANAVNPSADAPENPAGEADPEIGDEGGEGMNENPIGEGGIEGDPIGEGGIEGGFNMEPPADFNPVSTMDGLGEDMMF